MGFSMTISDTWHRLPRPVRIVLTRLPLLVPQMLGVIFVTFILVRLLPGDPVLLMLGNMATEESIATLRDQLGLDGSIFSQFLVYFQNLIQGDLGISLFTSNPVVKDLLERAPATLELITYAMILTLLIAVPTAIYATVRPKSIVDRASRVYGLAAGSLPDFWVALLLIFIFFTTFGIAVAPFGRIDPMLSAPEFVTGFYTIDALLAGDLRAFMSAASRLLLPIITLAIVNSGALLKMTSSAFGEIWYSDFIQHKRASGVPENKIIRAALRNSLPPLITLTGFLFGFLLGAAVLVETIFSWGGLGQYAVMAVINSDYPALQGFVLVAAAFILIVYLIVDVLYEIVDPRIEV